MTPVSRSHPDYLAFVLDQLRKEYNTPEARLFLQRFYSDLIFWITAIDLSATASLMRGAYSSKPRGRKPHDPADMLRCLLLMTKLGLSVDEGVVAIRTTPVYAILCGFNPGESPGVGTFYDFFPPALAGIHPA
ncbi:transposase [Cohnella massiliensis]|uniref:transposase n=1 Tax=Cohnella massiliensis TaxID=1816691 RepID=UPI001FE87A16|nr:transposase [Cohnella massiliensis]